MVHSQTIETYGRQAWPILLSVLQDPFIPLLMELQPFYPSLVHGCGKSPPRGAVYKS